MPETLNPIDEKYIAKVLEFTRRLYEPRKQAEGTRDLLEPVNPILETVHTSLLSLVEAVRNQPDLHLMREGGRFSLWGNALQFALPGNDEEHLVFCRASYQQPMLPWSNQTPKLREFYMVRAEAQDVNIARNFTIALAYPSHLMWSSHGEYSALRYSQRPIPGRQLIVRFNERGNINDIIYGTPNRNRFQSLTGLKEVPPESWGHESVPWMFDFRIGEDSVGIEFHKGATIKKLHSGAGGELLDGNKKSNFNLPKCLELVVADFSIPVLSAA